MKKVIALIVLVVLWYFAGMYRQTAVMSIVVCGAVIVPVLAVLALFQKRHLTLRFPKTQLIAFKNLEKPIRIYADNSGPLPVNFYKVWLYLSYPHDKKPQKRKFTGSALSKKHNADNASEFYFTAPYCGLVTIQMKKMKVYDNLALFSSKKRLDEQLKVMVFPVPVEMNISMPPFGNYENEPLTETSSDKRGEDHSEIRMIREYRPGDLNRYIHRNHSAKTGSLWVKEFCKENDYIFDVILNTSSSVPLSAETADAMYEIFYSLLMTLLHREALLRVHWFDANTGTMTDYPLETSEEATELLGVLFNTDTTCTPEQFAAAASLLPKKAMTINTALEWTFDEKPVYRFSILNYQRELSSVPFTLH